MMYNNKLSACLKVNGKVLREFKDEVYIPFDSEYSILIKNHSDVRVQAKIAIDGSDISDGTHFVIQPNSEVELERFLKNGNMNQGNRFKFIERTEKIEDHRGIKVDDGVIRIEYQFEEKTVINTVHVKDIYQHNHYFDGYHYHAPFWSSGGGMTGGRGMSSGVSSSAMGSQLVSLNNTIACSYEAQNCSMPIQDFNDAGITAPGSISEQKFVASSYFPVQSHKHAIVLKIRGKSRENKPLLRPVTVDTKLNCTMCGTSHKVTSKFCSHCGCSLVLVA